MSRLSFAFLALVRRKVGNAFCLHLKEAQNVIYYLCTRLLRPLINNAESIKSFFFNSNSLTTTVRCISDVRRCDVWQHFFLACH